MVPQETLRDAILNMPALAPPPGVVPNFIDPPTNRPVMLGVCISMFVIMTLAVAIRTYTKLALMKRLALEDCEFESAFAARFLTIDVDLIISAWVGLEIERLVYWSDISRRSYHMLWVIRPSVSP